MEVWLDTRRFLTFLGALSQPGIEMDPVPLAAMLDGYLLKAICHVVSHLRRVQMAVLLQILTGCDWP